MHENTLPSPEIHIQEQPKPKYVLLEEQLDALDQESENVNVALNKVYNAQPTEVKTILDQISEEFKANYTTATKVIQNKTIDLERAIQKSYGQTDDDIRRTYLAHEDNS